jgi:thiopeptide-type bacteriocin biosynthesis protein
MEWRQVNVALTRPDGDPRPSARRLFADLLPVVAMAREAGALELFFFQRKTPDVRLRFGGTELDAVVLPAVEARLTSLGGADVGAVASWYPSVYEPEVRQYGGPGATDAVHRHFDADTSVWAGLQDVITDPRLAPLVPNAATVMTVMANDLFQRVLNDRDEVWDTWANLADIALPPAPHLDLALEIGDGTFRSMIAGAVAPVGELLSSYADSLDQFAADLLTELVAGQLEAGLRAILPFVVQADFPRGGLDGPAQGTIATAMRAAWDPRQDLRGV